MQVLLFASSAAPHAAKALQAVAELDPGAAVDLCGHPARLFQVVRKLGPKPAVLVLVPGDRADLEALAQGRGDLDDRRVLLVLPDDNPETLALGHLLRPRAVCFAWSQAAEIRCVLARMLQPPGRPSSDAGPLAACAAGGTEP
jgi:hypothetical protein